MLEWLQDNIPTTYARAVFYSRAFMRSFFLSFTILLRESGIQTAVLFVVAFAASLLLPGFAGSFFALGVTALAIVIGSVTLMLLAYHCHFSAGWTVSLPSLAQPISFGSPPQRWNELMAPVVIPVIAVIALFYVFGAPSGVLMNPIDMSSKMTFVQSFGVHFIFIVGAVVLVQGIAGIAGVATVHHHEDVQPVFGSAFSRVSLVGAVLAASFAPILIFAIAPLLGLVGQIFVAGYLPPIYLLLLIQGVWTWAATSILAAEILQVQIRRGAAYT